MAAVSSETLQALAEALAPIAKQLAAGLLRRPLPDARAQLTSGDEAVEHVAELHAQAVPILRDAMADLDGLDADETEEAAEDLADPLFALVEGARALHAVRLAPDAEALRPYLTALVEDPATDCLELFLHVIQAALNPWEIFADPEHPDLDFSLKSDAPAHLEALRELCRARPGLLSGETLERLAAALGC